MGVNIAGSTNIAVRDVIARKCWGDGFYIGATATQNFCQDIELSRIVADAARRNGLSLISAKNFLCRDGQFINTAGTSPQAGVDIEPNDPSQFLQGIVFDRPYSANNVAAGFSVAFGGYVGSPNPIDILFLDPRDDGSDACLWNFGGRSILGTIKAVRPVGLNARHNGIVIRNKGITGPNLLIDAPSIRDWNRSGGSSGTYSSGLGVYADASDTGTEGQGGVDIVRAKFTLNSGAAVGGSISCIEARTTTPDPMDAITIDNSMDLAGLFCTTRGVTRFTDPQRASVRTLGNADESMSVSSAAAHYVTRALTASRTYSLGALHSIGREIIFEIGVAPGGAFQPRLAFNPGDTLFPIPLGASNYIYSTQRGARLKIRKVSATEWFIVEMIGTWTSP
jgi:hypothetical protein